MRHHRPLAAAALCLSLLSSGRALAQDAGATSTPASPGPFPEVAGRLGGGPRGLLLAGEAALRLDRLRLGLGADAQVPIGEQFPSAAGGPVILQRLDLDLAASAGLVTAGRLPAHLRSRVDADSPFWRADLALEAGRTFARVGELAPIDQPPGPTRWMGFWFAGLRGTALVCFGEAGRGVAAFGVGGFLRWTLGREARVETAAGTERGGWLVGGVFLAVQVGLGR